MAIQLPFYYLAVVIVMSVLSFTISVFALDRLAAWEKGNSARQSKGSEALAFTPPSKDSRLPFSPSSEKEEPSTGTWTYHVGHQMWRSSSTPAYWDRGIVVSPVPCPDRWFQQSFELRIESALVNCVQTFATLARKEVMISAQVAKTKISINTGILDGEEALKAFRSSIEARGIAVISLDANTLALVARTNVEAALVATAVSSETVETVLEIQQLP